MMPFDDALLYMQTQGQDKSDTAATFFKLMYNVGYKIILTEFQRQVTEEESTTSMVVGQRGYQVPPECLTPKGFELLDDTTVDPLIEVSSDTNWSLLKSGDQRGRPTHFHYKPRFGIGAGVVELSPVPSSASYILRITYEARDKDLSQLAVVSGTVNLTYGSATVSGAGTSFSTAMIGRYLIPTSADTNGLPLRITGVASSTSLQLENGYSGPDKSAANYRIVEIANLPDDMQIIPCYFALEQHWSSKGNVAKQQEFERKWMIAMNRAKKTHSGMVRGGVISPGGFTSPFPQYPINFPANIAE